MLHITIRSIFFPKSSKHERSLFRVTVGHHEEYNHTRVMETVLLPPVIAITSTD